MFNKKEIAELQAQIKTLQNIPESRAEMHEIELKLERILRANQVTMVYQDERIQTLEMEVEKLKTTIKRIVDYVGMTGGHLS